MKGKSRLLLMAGALALSGASVQAQRVPRTLPARPRPVPRVQPVPKPRSVPKPNPRANVLPGGQASDLPRRWLEQLQRLDPAEQERFLKNNQRFKSLAPEQQDLIRNRLQAWNALPAEQRQELLERQQIWEQLPPEQRQQVRDSLLPRWQSLAPARRQVILGKLRELRELDATQRNDKLNDEGFLENLNPDERQMLRDLAGLGAVDTAG